MCENDELYAPMLAWTLNCLLAPTEFLSKMNEGAITLSGQSMAEKYASVVPAAEEKKEEEQAEVPMSKRQKKRNKRKNKELSAADAQEEEEELPDIAGLLFHHDQDIAFASDSLFCPDSLQLHSEPMDQFKLTPKELYEEIVNLAEKRYGYKILPKELSELTALKSPMNKMALLRDVCKLTGVQLDLRSCDLVLANDGQQMRDQFLKKQ